MEDNIKIRQPGKKDKEQVMKLVKGLYGKSSNEQIGIWERDYNNYLSWTYVAEIEGKIVGYISLGGNQDSLSIGDLYVLSKFRKKGIASELIKRAISKQEKMEKKYLTVNARKSNRNSQRLYKKFGFVVVGEKNEKLLELRRLPITPKINFRAANFNETIGLIIHFINGSWGNRILKGLPELERCIAQIDSLKEKEKLIKEHFKKLEKSVNLNQKAAEYQLSWNEINDAVLIALSKVVEKSWPIDCRSIIARVTLNPMCPRFLKLRMFDINYRFSIERMRETVLHEMLHFIYFEKWKEVFPQTPENEFGQPHLIWRLSEMVPKVILNDKRIQTVLPHEVKVYPEFYQIQIKRIPLLDHLQKIYDIKKNFADFLKKSYEFVKENEKALIPKDK